jgi:hypothetical protein
MSKEYCRRLSVQGVGVYEELLLLCREVSLPWCGVLLEGCEGLLYKGGLYTQCCVKSEGKYCVGCMVRKSSGKWLGDVSDRMKCKIGEYSVGVKKEISYMKWLRKNGISREMSEREASSRGLSIPLEHFEERDELKKELVVEREKKKRGRPRKSECVEGDVESVVEGDVEPVKEKKKRGRPRKEKSVSSNNEGEELIASLLSERKEEIVKEASSDDEEETLVIKIEIDGKTYLKSEDNTVYDFMSHDELGIWNEKENKIVVG